MNTREDDPVAAAVADLSPPTSALARMSEQLAAQIADGLAGRPSSLRLLPTFVRQPRGDESRRVLFLDWGGTHGRAGAVELDGRGGVRIIREETFTFGEEDRHAPAERVFDIMAGAVGRAAGGESLPLGFAYSYPARLERIDRAVALALTKGWRTPGLVGRDVTGLLAEALARRPVRGVSVAAICNDTVACLALSSYRARGRDRGDRHADIGLIVATGTNQAADLGPHGIRNLESGNFDGVAEIESAWDVALDRELEDPAPGAQRFEKMAAGHCLGEIVRRAVRDLADRSRLFRGWGTTPAFASPLGLDAVTLSLIERDTAPDLADTDRVLRALSVESSPEERRALRAIAAAAVTRSARLVAAALVGALRFIDPGLDATHRVAVDGSLYGGYPGYGALVRRGIEELAGRERAGRIAMEFTKDSTGLGAAVIAASVSADR